MMSIFSLMGVSSRRSDDTHTFLVIQKAIESIVPALLISDSSKGLGVMTLMQEVITHLGTFFF